MIQYVFRKNELLAATVIKELQSRNMTGYYAKDKAEALAIALCLIPEGSKVAMGSSLSVHEIGLHDALKNGNYNFVDQIESEDKRKAMLFSYDANFFLSSANVITNKVCADVDAAMKRARNVAAPANANHYCQSTPCVKTGTCLDCKSPDNVCCQFLMTRYFNHTDRIHVILVNEELGF